jgi:hypothetical protein
VSDRLVGIKLPEAPGMTCSEFLTNASENYEVCHKVNHPAEYITPADYQEFSMLNPIAM